MNVLEIGAYLWVILGGLILRALISAVTLKLAILGHNAFVRRDWPASVVRTLGLGEATLFSLATTIFLSVAVRVIVTAAPADTVLPRLKSRPRGNYTFGMAPPATTLIEKNAEKQAERQAREKAELVGAIRLYSWIFGIYFAAASMLAMLMPTTYVRACLVTFYSMVMSAIALVLLDRLIIAVGLPLKPTI